MPIFPSRIGRRNDRELRVPTREQQDPARITLTPNPATGSGPIGVRWTGPAQAPATHILRAPTSESCYRTIKPAHAGAIIEALGGVKIGGDLVEAYLFDLLPVRCRGLVEIKYAGMLTSGKWTLPTKGLSRNFAGQFEELYKLCVSNVKVRQRTKEWIEVMRETSS